jgi:RNA ligase (TIGR02306 family)
VSDLVVDVCRVETLKPHENGDRLEIAVVKGWECVVPRDKYKVGDTCVFFPPDTIISQEIGEQYGVIPYLKKLPRWYDVSEFNAAGRVGVANIRGVPSFGLVVPYDGDRPIGTNLSTSLDVVKYDPPEPTGEGDAERQNSFFHTYTDIQNLKNFPDAFEEGEFVLFLEKIHGKNTRLGYCFENDEFVYMAGSHGTRRRQYTPQEVLSVYWEPYTLYPNVKDLMKFIHSLHENNVNIVLFGEMFGCGVQDLRYGLTQKNPHDFCIFDIAVNGQYLNIEEVFSLCSAYEVPTAPVLYAGPFSRDVVEVCTSGNTLMTEETHIREGIVIHSRNEVRSDKYGRRKIYKNISFDYLNRKGGTEFH